MPMRTLKKLLTLGAVLALLAGAPTLAAGRALVTPDGDVFQVEEIGSGPFARALRTTIHRADGSTEIGLVPRTADRAWDAFPTLALDPDTGQPALVWSRHNGVDFDLVLSLHDGKRWSAPVSLVSTPADEIHARAFTAPGEGLHVIWTLPGRDLSFFYGLFRTGSGVAVLGPERVPLKRFFPGSGLDPADTEGGNDDPGIQPGGAPPPSDSGTNPPTGDDSCASQEGFSMCLEAATPAAAVVCGGFSVVVEVRGGQCLLNRSDAGWLRGVCAPAGTDLKGALESLRLACGKK